MTNRFGFTLEPHEIRWAAAEGASEDVIAAVLLLHDRSVDEIAPQLVSPRLSKSRSSLAEAPACIPVGRLKT
jgi:hypothetical protein